MLLGQPGKALHELLLVRDLCRLMEGRPTSKPMTLVAAMINVAVTGLYAQTFADGVRLHVWREPELSAIQDQVAQVDLAPALYESLQDESASDARILEITTSAQLADLFGGSSVGTFWAKAKDPIHEFCFFAPRGWIYQGWALGIRLHERGLAGFDRSNNLILPNEVDGAKREMEYEFAHRSPYNFMVSQMVPNTARAIQTMAKNQTLINEAYVVCALERYRLARGQSPEKLDALVPQFAAQIPADLIGGEPLKYRTEGGKIVLYSIGWNEKDDGVKPALKEDGSGDSEKNDWAWPYSQ